MGGLLSCLGPQYEGSGEQWQAHSKWQPQHGVITVDANTQGSVGYNEQASPLQPSPNIHMLQIPSPPQRAAQPPAHISPTEQAAQRQESGDAFPEDSKAPHAPVNWKRGDLIGAGAFGRVYLGMNNDNGELIAIKQVAVSKESANAGRVAQHVRELEREVSVLKQLDHPNIVRYLGTDRSQDCLNIFLEYVPGGSIASLLSKFGSFKEKVIKIYARQILLGLQYLHDHKIMHRDIKGANILVDKAGSVKLADFGASKIIEDLVTIDSGVKSIKGTSYWMAPEVIKQTGHGRMADIWSVGCTVVEMATGKPPWSQYTSQVAAMFHIASSKGPPPIPEHLSPEAKDFLLLCFTRTPSDRPNAARLLKHPFLADVIKTSPSGPLSDSAAMQSPYRAPTPARNLAERSTIPRDRAPSVGTQPQDAGNQNFMRMYSPMANRLTTLAVDQHAQSNSGPQGPSEVAQRQQASEWRCMNEGNLRQSVASKASTRYDGAEEDEDCQLRSHTSDSDYNPVEEPSWLQQDSLQASGFHYNLENSPPNSLLHHGLHRREYASPGRSKPSKEGSLENFASFVQEKALKDVAEMSTAVLPHQQRSKGAEVDKRQLWEAEILQELAEQRDIARRI